MNIDIKIFGTEFGYFYEIKAIDSNRSYVSGKHYATREDCIDAANAKKEIMKKIK